MESSPAYKHRLVSDLTSLTSLDGEPITPRDSEVAERFFERHTEYRPTSAVGSGRPGTSEASERPETPSGLPPRPSSSGGPKVAPTKERGRCTEGEEGGGIPGTDEEERRERAKRGWGGGGRGLSSRPPLLPRALHVPPLCCGCSQRRSVRLPAPCELLAGCAALSE